MTKLYFFGDSICFGQYVSPHKTWVHLLSRQFSNILIQNPSVNGDITRTALDRIHHDVLSHKPDMVYIQFGLNDCNIWDTDKGVCRVTRNMFKSNLEEMVIRCKSFDINTIFMATNHATNTINSDYNKRNQDYNNIIREVSYNNCLLFDIEKVWYNDGSLLMNDGVHLSEDGHIFYYITVKNLLEESGKYV